MKKLTLLISFLMLSVSMFSQKVITVKGSDTMVILAQRWAETYMGKNKEAVIQVTGGGSGTGIAALINGSTDICNASRPMKPSEREKLKSRFNSLGVEVKVAKDGLSIYLNNANPVKELTVDQIKDIYSGKITNWKEVGGKDARIIVYGRENSSGTYVFFKDNVLDGKDFTPTMQSLPGTAAVANAVVKDKNAIGFGGAAYAVGVKFAAIKEDANSQAYFPDEDTIRSGKYPLSRFLFMYLKSKPTGEIKNFIDWILGSEGQSLIAKVGYFPVK